jgi:hypothetical protein
MIAKTNIKLKLESWVIYPIYIIMILSFFGSLRSCSTSAENKKLRKELTEVKIELDSIYSALDNIYSKDELDIRMEIDGLKTSKRTLYFENAVVRNVVRPDDIIQQFDDKIDALEKKLKDD